MPELDRLWVRVLGDITDLESKMSKADRVVRRTADQMAAAGRGLTIGLTLPLGVAGVAAVTAAADMDRLRRALTAITGSTRETETQLARLERVARLPGLGFREAIQGSIRLQASFGDIAGRAQLAEDVLRGFGNAIAIAGGGAAQLDQVTRALGQIAAKGKVSAEEINQIAEAIPQIRVVMEEIFGTANTELLQQQNIAALDFIRGITEGLLELDPVTGGVANQFENFTDALFRARAAIGEHLLPVVTPLVEGLSALLEEASDLDPAMTRLGIAFGAALAVAGPLTIAISALTTAVVALKVAGVSLLLTFGVGGAIIAGLSALVGWFVHSKLEAAEFAAELEKVGTAAEDAAAGLDHLTRAQALQTGRGLINTLNELKAAREELLELGRASASAQGVALGRRLPGGRGAPVAEAEAVNQLTDEQRRNLEQLERQIVATEGALKGLAGVYDTLGDTVADTNQQLEQTARVTPVFEATAGNVERLGEAIAQAQDQLGDLRFELAFETGATAAEDLRQQITEVTGRLELMQDASDELARSLEEAFRRAGEVDIGVVGPSGQRRPSMVGRAVDLASEELSKLPPILQNVGTAATGLGQIMQNRLGRAFTGVGSALSALAGGLAGSLNPATAAMGVFGGVFGAVSSLFSEGASEAEKLANRLRSLFDTMQQNFELLDLSAEEEFRRIREVIEERLGPSGDFVPGPELVELFETNLEAFFERIATLLEQLEQGGQAGLAASAELASAFGFGLVLSEEERQIIEAWVTALEQAHDRLEDMGESAERAARSFDDVLAANADIVSTGISRIGERAELLGLTDQQQFDAIKAFLQEQLPDSHEFGLGQARLGDLGAFAENLLRFRESGVEQIGARIVDGEFIPGIPIDALIDAALAMNRLGDESTDMAEEMEEAARRLQERRQNQLGLLNTRFELLDIPVEQQIEQLNSALAELLPPHLADLLEADFRAFSHALLENAKDAIALGQDEIFGVDVDFLLSLASQIERLGDQSKEAADEIEETTSQLLNAPAGFKVALHRFNATVAGLTHAPIEAPNDSVAAAKLLEQVFGGPSLLPEMPRPAPITGGGIVGHLPQPGFRGTDPTIPRTPEIPIEIREGDTHIHTVNIDAGGKSPEQTWREIERVIDREGRRGGASRLDVRKT